VLGMIQAHILATYNLQGQRMQQTAGKHQIGNGQEGSCFAVRV
jgi:hypothetical protein